MNRVKHIIPIIFIVLVGLVSNVNAKSFVITAADTTVTLTEEQEKQFERMERALLYGLTSDVQGVVESTLFNAIHYKLTEPLFFSEKLEKRLNEIAVDDPNQTLRYKAYLTISFYNNAGQFGDAETLLTYIDNRNQNRIFSLLNDKVQEGLAAATH